MMPSSSLHPHPMLCARMTEFPYRIVLLEQDFELFHRVGVERCRDLLLQAIVNGTHYTLDVELLESLRRQCARRALF